MRKYLIAVLIGSILTLFMSGSAFSQGIYYDYYKEVKLIIGKKDATVNETKSLLDQPAYIKGGRTLVPFRFLGEALGAQVNWDATKKQAVLELGDRNVVVTVGSKSATVNGEVGTLDVAPEITKGRIFIPLRFVSEQLGAYVDYDSDQQEVLVRYVNNSGWLEYKYPGETEASYRYPVNWTLTADINGIPCFNSPNGSKLWCYGLPDRLNDSINYMKEEQKKNGYTLISEELVYPEDPEYGVCLTFSMPSDRANVDYVDYLYILDDGEQSYVYDMKIYETDINMDWVVMTEITGGL